METKGRSATRATLVPFLLVASLCAVQRSEAGLPEEARSALRKAASYYRSNVASHGGYVYYYSLDFSERWGEGKVSRDTIVVQSPGTPRVGMAYVQAYRATADPYYLEAATKAALALIHGQLQSGGWTQVVHFAKPERGRLGRYRLGRPAGKWNMSSFDDGQTQKALEFLIQVDEAHEFENKDIHEATQYALNALLQAQFTNGAFPQVMSGPVLPQPILQARFPSYDWKTEGRFKNYWDYYTLNDGLVGDMAQTLIVAYQTYKDERFMLSLAKLGDFLVLAQMPEPQPGWCQQYNYQMVPIWARKFEPPAIAGWESQDALETLITIALHTGDKKYLEPVAHGLEYLRRSQLRDGQLARYYEFGTNRPLYMDNRYRLTYDDSAVPRHYGWKVPTRLEVISHKHQAVKQGHDPGLTQAMTSDSTKVQEICRSLDDHGRWISVFHGERLIGQPNFARGYRYLSSEVFAQNLETLSAYLAAQMPRE